jgi:hypothetical protein
MKAVRLLGIIALVLALFLGLSFQTAAAAKLPVPVNLAGQALDGVIDTEGYIQTLPNGTKVPYTLPANKMIIVNYFYVHYIPPSPGGPFVFAIVSPDAAHIPFYRWALDINFGTGTSFGLIQTVTPGLPLTVLPVMRVETPDGTPVTDGTLKVRFFGIVQ